MKSEEINKCFLKMKFGEIEFAADFSNEDVLITLMT